MGKLKVKMGNVKIIKTGKLKIKKGNVKNIHFAFDVRNIHFAFDVKNGKRTVTYSRRRSAFELIIRTGLAPVLEKNTKLWYIDNLD